MARTILDEILYVRPEYIEHQLAHAVKEPNGRAYNRTAHLGERKKMMQLWSDYLDGIKAGGEGVAIRKNGGLTRFHSAELKRYTPTQGPGAIWGLFVCVYWLPITPHLSSGLF